MIRFRRLSSLLLALLMLLCVLPLSACHGSRDRVAFTVPESFDRSKQHEITFWAKNDTNKTQTAIYQKAISDFQALYPNITVNMRLYTDYGRIYNDVITNIATNTTPNVCITYPDHIATYMTGSDVVVPLDDLFADARYGLGGSELLYDSPTQEEIIRWMICLPMRATASAGRSFCTIRRHRRRSFRSFSASAPSAAFTTPFPTCVPPKPAM